MRAHILLRHLAACAAACISLFCARCSVGPVAGGGTDMPNGTVVAGRVVAPDSSAAQGAIIRLSTVIITASGDSVCAQWLDTTDAGGKFKFQNVTAGRHVLYAVDGAGAAAAINQFVDIASDTGLDIALGDIRLCRHINLVGRITVPRGMQRPPDIRVFVPGMQQVAVSDSLGRYRLEGIPPGCFDIAFVRERIANFTRVAISDDPQGDIILRDIEFAVTGCMANAEYNEHDNKMDNSFYVSPRHYRRDSVPEWYGDIDTVHVRYFALDSTTNKFGEWQYDSLKALAYDMILAGVLTQQEDTVVLTTPAAETFILVGELLVAMPKQGEFVIAAVKMKRDDMTGVVTYEVIIIEQPPAFRPNQGET